jgi:hypothetical protein
LAHSPSKKHISDISFSDWKIRLFSSAVRVPTFVAPANLCTGFKLFLLKQKSKLAMKGTLYFPRIGLLMLLFAAALSSCKKDEDPGPVDPATTVAGSYAYSELTFNGQTLPGDKTDLKGSVTLTRQSATLVKVEANIRLKSSNAEFIVADVEGVEVADLGSGSYGLRYEAEEFAQVKGSKLTLKGVDEEGVNFTITATK